MRPSPFARTTRGEQRKAHEWRKAQAHTHNVYSERKRESVDVRCTRADCKREVA
jgi:hypothetical protein